MSYVAHAVSVSLCAGSQRVVPVYRERVASSIRMEGLDNTWTVERCMEYLMLCGASTEAAWLAHDLGDWKTAVLIGVAVKKHEALIPELYQRYSDES